MHILFLIIVIGLIGGLIYWPGYWVNKVLVKYKEPDDLFSGTGGELAVHLLEQLNIDNVGVEEARPGQDHYDPIMKVVRLSPDNFNGKSLTAITVAAHEVGHVMQDESGYSLFKLRHKLVKLAHYTEKLGSIAIVSIPVFALLTHSPVVGGGLFLLGILGIAFGTLVHLVTLPVEWDASFKRALPLLIRGEYINEMQSKHARKILKAAALTYVASSLASILNFYRWIAILRR
ncbi:MAG: peptidase [endosymbiont of Galathealinum brachiosum]|uniref:Peptidase n=1 Tax=endosymbiont of Galathealinum brachiosum TaxID=2200906 RepID=A0A370DIM6_9GAMM|nr:MAG: peptidase [endosymbiont of Galathealinum brachiosum]